jgi:phosphatidylglycerol:prolipoprotein diacylglycerol transferase
MNAITWQIDPIMLALGPLKLHWYGVFFALAVVAGNWLFKAIYAKEGRDLQSLDALFIYVIVGVIVGARLGHCLFYDPQYYLANPLEILYVWQGGLASHGGGLGVILALALYVKKHQVSFLWLLDRMGMAAAVFGFFVRTGNFFNSEIIGIPTNVPWAITFLRIDNLPRHPVQLYEAFAYLAIFGLLATIYTNTTLKNQKGFLFGLFLTLALLARFALEFVKVKQAAYSSDFALTTGQLLSLPFLLVGIALLVWSTINHRKT